MKKKLVRILIWQGLTILMMTFWIIGLAIGFAVFPDAVITVTAEGNEELMLYISSSLNTGVILYFIYNSQYRGWKMVGALVLISFGIQFFMSQIETLWFNDSLNMDLGLIYAVVMGGGIMNVLFSITATWLTGRFKKSNEEPTGVSEISWMPLFKRGLILVVVVWPLIYFFAGYFIAWQFEDVREFYSDTVESGSFVSIMIGNFTSGLYFFQILRGGLWILIAIPVLMIANVSLVRKGIVLGLLFSVLGASQLLLPNPIMSEMVRMAHLLETSTSNFLWGFVLVLYLGKGLSIEPVGEKGKLDVEDISDHIVVY